MSGQIKYPRVEDAIVEILDDDLRENALLFAGKNYIITKTNSRHRQGEKAWIGKWGKY